MNHTSSHTELVYYVIRDKKPVRAINVVNLIHNYDIQELAVALSQVIHIQAEGKCSSLLSDYQISLNNLFPRSPNEGILKIIRLQTAAAWEPLLSRHNEAQAYNDSNIVCLKNIICFLFSVWARSGRITE